MSSAPKRLPRAVREQLMLDAAVEVFAERGYRGTSMDAVAAAAGISKPMLYLYYGSKEELFAACVRREETRFLETIAEAVDPTIEPRRQIENVIDVFLRFVDTNRDSWRMLFSRSGVEPGLHDLVDTARTRMVEVTAQLLATSFREPREEREYHLMAVALIGAGEAVAEQLVTDGVGVAEARELLVGLAWRGLSARRPE